MSDEKKLEEQKSGGAFFYISSWLSVVSFLTSAILLWQGLVELKNFSGEFEDWKDLIHSLLTFQNQGLLLIIAAFFLLLFALQLSIYALILKKR